VILPGFFTGMVLALQSSIQLKTFVGILGGNIIAT
jgi:hypothetical protein